LSWFEVKSYLRGVPSLTPVYWLDPSTVSIQSTANVYLPVGHPDNPFSANNEVARLWYADGALGDLRLDPRAARTAVRTYVRGVPTTLRSLRVASVVVTTRTVTVRTTAVAHLPFLSLLTGRGVAVVAEASAVNSVG